jgi:homoserine O-succinyltransferase
MLLWGKGLLPACPPFPRHYFGCQEQALLNEYRARIEDALAAGRQVPEFPERQVAGRLDNTWHDTGEAVVGNWIGLMYQITHRDRQLPFMAGVDPDNPLGLK